MVLRASANQVSIADSLRVVQLLTGLSFSPSLDMSRLRYCSYSIVVLRPKPLEPILSVQFLRMLSSSQLVLWASRRDHPVLTPLLPT